MKTTILILSATILGFAASRPPSGAAQSASDLNESYMQAAGSMPAPQLAPSHGAAKPAAAAPRVGTQIEETVRKAMPAVVQVIVPGSGMGSGFIMLPSGIVVTNAHVVDEVAVGDDVVILTADTKPQTGTLLAKGEGGKKDIAFIQIPPVKNGWSTLTMKPSARMALGSEVLTMGYPRGLPFTVNRGIISGLNRKNEHITFMQTDASINPGNSGGPLVALDGAVVGINTQIITESGGSEGLGFAIISEDINRAWKQYLKIDNLDTPWLGVMLDPELAVQQIITDSPAKKAGIKLDDVIVEFEGAQIESMEDFLHELHMFMPGDTVKLLVLRNGKPRKIPVVLESEKEVKPQRIAAQEADHLPV
jgi:S1-C subfamily serine protease